MNPTSVFERNLKIFNAGVRRIINKGGTSSSKTTSELELALLIAQKRANKGVLISVVSESLPHLKMGAIRDFDNLLKRENIYDENNIDLSNHTYHFGKSMMEFFSADSGKASGPRRDILILNECNHIPYKTVEQLEIRTAETIFYDFNPTAEFWLEEKVLTVYPTNEWEVIKSNYKDNHHLSDAIKRDIERKAERDPNFKRIHIDVEYGSYEGLIFASPTIIKAFPTLYRWKIYSLDFGFTNDPTTLNRHAFGGGELFHENLVYQVGMTNADIGRALAQNGVIKGRDVIVADSAEPKSIKELRDMGWNVIGAVKGKDSINNGIDLMKRFKHNITQASVHMIKEWRNYTWSIDRASGKHINVPVDMYNHTIDPTRYALTHIAARQVGQGAPRSVVPQMRH